MKSNCLMIISFCCCLQRSCHLRLFLSGTGIFGSTDSISGIPSQVTDQSINQSGSARPKSISVPGLSLASISLSTVRYPVTAPIIALAIHRTRFQTKASPTISNPIILPELIHGLQLSITLFVLLPGSLRQ